MEMIETKVKGIFCKEEGPRESLKSPHPHPHPHVGPQRAPPHTWAYWSLPFPKI